MNQILGGNLCADKAGDFPRLILVDYTMLKTLNGKCISTCSSVSHLSWYFMSWNDIRGSSSADEFIEQKWIHLINQAHFLTYMKTKGETYDKLHIISYVI